MLEHLTRLAHDRAPARRAELLVAIIDLYRAAGARAEGSLGPLFGDIVRQLLPGLPGPQQAGVATRLAELATLPHALALELAVSGGFIGEAMLRGASVLTDDDLLDLAGRVDEEGLMAIAARVPLSERMSDALVALGGARLCRAVAANRSARLSPQCLARIVASCGAGSAADLRPPADIVAFPAVQGAERRRFGEPMGAVIPWPKATLQRPATAASPVAAAIAAIASSDRMLEVAMLLAAHAGLPPDLVSRLIARPDPSLLAVLCRAASVPPSTFSVIARIRGRRFGHPLSETMAVEAAYAELTEAEARATLGSMKALQRKA
ncbi:Uncharacterized conserved protein, DUF2336 family [Kaistia soli DSM 19436]|uniref:Uncharacterized conserved protein, DUF2336 family n=1 Tax=Kaistia soli DSM 19436 TaxID=1122133 RepID=A0A1M4ZTV5_9HYPH|nr:DUF2336 domain-containing protein [Kaistia soli]SHF21510.1 Uncharacterized conserved protein, DUF2336 family [Kaistia soli DSM 19436]